MSPKLPVSYTSLHVRPTHFPWFSHYYEESCDDLKPTLPACQGPRFHARHLPCLQGRLLFFLLSLFFFKTENASEERPELVQQIKHHTLCRLAFQSLHLGFLELLGN